ncbi:protein accumulation and replication of chloroplasts 6, chloroplastic [Nicotiana attenuata]|uniref:Protein accumulation and replication of chloroplasts 6, chloroplastic n=1 Tax=Nicotiana attenuata TaxID=49451 RepID=A0A1J6K0E2_NICAT|nr:protein accumulation and replication of chloroplasts 6, chloroplastic [Nicotiana attenuata]
MEMDRFLPPYNYYNDPRARHPWLIAVLNIPATTPAPRPEVLSQNFNYAQGNDSYAHCNTGYGALNMGYQHHFNQTPPLYTSNFSPQHPWQVSSPQHVPYIYQPSEFATAVPNFWTAGVVSEGAAAIGSVADTRMIGTNCRFEYPNPSVSFQYQQFPVSTYVSDFSPKDLSVDEENTLFMCPSPLDMYAHKMFDEMSVNEIGEPFDESVSPEMNEIKEMVQKLALQMTSLSSRQDRQVQRYSSQPREIKDSWESKRNLDDHTYLVVEEIKKREIEQRNCPLTSEKLETLVAMVNNNENSHIIPAPTAAETATCGVFGEITEDHELAMAHRVSMVEEDLSAIGTEADNMDARQHKEVEPVVTLVDSQNILMHKDEVKVAEEETVIVETDMGTELADICEGPAETKNDVDGNTYFPIQEVEKYIEESSIQLFDERPEAINIVLNDNVSSHIIHVPAAVTTAVGAEKNHHIMRDPITTSKKYMSEKTLTSEVELKGIDKKIDKLVEEVVEFADASPVPDHSQLLEHVIADPRSFIIGPDRRHVAHYSLMVSGIICETGATSKFVKENSSAEFVGKHWFLLPSTMTAFALSEMLRKETRICKEEKHIAYRLMCELLTDTSTSRVKKKRKRSGDEKNLEAVAYVVKQLDEFDKRHIKLEYMTSKRACEQLQNRGVIRCDQIDSYNREETVGSSIVWHNGVALVLFAQACFGKKPHIVQEVYNHFQQLHQRKVTSLDIFVLVCTVGENCEIDFPLKRGLWQLFVGEADDCHSWLDLDSEDLLHKSLSSMTFVIVHSKDDNEIDLLFRLCKLLHTWLSKGIFSKFKKTLHISVKLRHYYKKLPSLIAVARMRGGHISPLVVVADSARNEAETTNAVDNAKSSAVHALQIPKNLAWKWQNMIRFNHCHKNQLSLAFIKAEVLGFFSKLFCDMDAEMIVEDAGSKVLRLFPLSSKLACQYYGKRFSLFTVAVLKGSMLVLIHSDVMEYLYFKVVDTSFECDRGKVSISVTSQGETENYKKVMCDPSHLLNKTILPQKKLGCISDVYLFCCSYTQNVAPKGKLSGSAEYDTITLHMEFQGVLGALQSQSHLGLCSHSLILVT